jgi:aryl-alcohol dehydrogenase-like predicted oxidoreductase
MRYRSLGRCGIWVSEVGLGTAQLANTDGRFLGVKRLSEDVAASIISKAVAGGVTFFDTAAEYGGAEELVGRITRGAGTPVVIATKAGLRNDGARDFSESYVHSHVERSLQRLGVECLDLFQLNKPSNRFESGADLFELLASLKRSGKIRHAGVVVGDIGFGRSCLDADVVDCIQVVYNLMHTETLALMRSAAAKGLGVIVRSPLQSGFLSGAYSPATTFQDDDERSSYFAGPAFADRLQRLRRIQEDLGVQDEELVEFSLRYIMSSETVSTVIPGASSVEQVQRYIACSGGTRLSADARATVEGVVAHHMRDFDQPIQQ